MVEIRSNASFLLGVIITSANGRLADTRTQADTCHIIAFVMRAIHTHTHTHTCIYLRLRIIMRTKAKRARDISNLLLPCWQPRRHCFASNEHVISSPPSPRHLPTRISGVSPPSSLREPRSTCLALRVIAFEIAIVRSVKGLEHLVFRRPSDRFRPEEGYRRFSLSAFDAILFPRGSSLARSTTGKFHCYFLFSSFVL